MHVRLRTGSWRGCTTCTLDRDLARSYTIGNEWDKLLVKKQREVDREWSDINEISAKLVVG